MRRDQRKDKEENTEEKNNLIGLMVRVIKWGSFSEVAFFSFSVTTL